MPLPAASDTMMVTGRLGYWACAEDRPIDSSKIAAAKDFKRCIASLPLILVAATFAQQLSGSLAALCRFGGRHREHGVERVGIARFAQARDGVRLAQQPRHARE